MGNTISVDVKMLRDILSRLDKLTSDIEAIKTKLFEGEPPYGSNEWWEKEMKEAEESFKKGEGISFDSAEEAIKWLKS